MVPGFQVWGFAAFLKNKELQLQQFFNLSVNRQRLDKSFHVFV